MRARFNFTVPLRKLPGGAPKYILEIPEAVTSAIGRRGPVPIVATLNKITEVHASLVPMGGGRHRLQLNARTRGELEIEPGDPVQVALVVPEKPLVLPLPFELSAALKEVDLLQLFCSQPAGKQNHIITWIERAVKSQTREIRIAKTIESMMRARERAYDQKS